MCGILWFSPHRLGPNLSSMTTLAPRWPPCWDPCWTPGWPPRWPHGAGSPGTMSRLALQWSWPYKSGTIKQHQSSNLETQNLAFVLHLQMLFGCSSLDNSNRTCTQDQPPGGSDLVLTDSASSGYKREDGQLSSWMWVSAAMENLQRRKLDNIKEQFFHYLETCRQGTNISLFCSFSCFVFIQVQNSV